MINNSKYLPFEEARDFVRKLGFKSSWQWKKYCKTDNKPNNIPTNPNQKYNDNGWLSWCDWLGTGKTSIRNEEKSIHFLTFEEARKFSRKLGLKGVTYWVEYWKTTERPIYIPSNPQFHYKDTGWIGWSDWLANENNRRTKRSTFLSFEEARNFIRSIKLKNSSKWNEYRQSGNMPNNIPTNPHTKYKNDGWVNFNDWLGNEKVYLPLDEAFKLTQSLKFKSNEEYKQYVRNNPDCGLPIDPEKTYNK
jgi:hypothetical protein